MCIGFVGLALRELSYAGDAAERAERTTSHGGFKRLEEPGAGGGGGGSLCGHPQHIPC